MRTFTSSYRSTYWPTSCYDVDRLTDNGKTISSFCFFFPFVYIASKSAPTILTTLAERSGRYSCVTVALTVHGLHPITAIVCLIHQQRNERRRRASEPNIVDVGRTRHRCTSHSHKPLSVVLIVVERYIRGVYHPYPVSVFTFSLVVV